MDNKVDPHPKIGSLYIGNLHPKVTESALYQTFSEIGPILSIRVCRDRVTCNSLGYAYVNFDKEEDAERALHCLNFTVLSGRPLRIMWSQRDPTLRTSLVANLFVKNLDPSINDVMLRNIFSAYGRVVSSKVAADDCNQSKGYGFVQYDSEDAAERAIKNLDGMWIQGKGITVAKFLPKKDRKSPNDRFTNVYVKNLCFDVDDEKLIGIFEVYGSITSAKVMLDENGNSRRFGFVNFKNSEDALEAVKELNNKWIGGNCLYVGRAEKKSEREEKLRKILKAVKGNYSFGTGNRFRNVFVKNLPVNINDTQLKRIFECYESLISAKVITDENGGSKGYGFLSFLNPSDALKAVTEKNGVEVSGKALFVGRALKRAEREALKAQIDGNNEL